MHTAWIYAQTSSSLAWTSSDSLSCSIRMTAVRWGWCPCSSGPECPQRWSWSCYHSWHWRLLISHISLTHRGYQQTTLTQAFQLNSTLVTVTVIKVEFTVLVAVTFSLRKLTYPFKLSYDIQIFSGSYLVRVTFADRSFFSTQNTVNSTSTSCMTDNFLTTTAQYC